MKNILFFLVMMLGSHVFACGYCTIFVLEEYIETTLTNLDGCDNIPEFNMNFNHLSIPENARAYFYLGQITAYYNALNDLRYRIIDYPSCITSK